ncbi:enoyl-CoA hydratase/isomerase family protein [Alicyclobacillus tolerans]|uniref:enoyl-CoA hydratase-related protein n=1 Tax=Alicyclobacillus tolerans TaxID=90970 RepID=UPI001F00A340|nr:enoyl-CoA hydratase-related protein [Alicyclobacillus tolerans]MCF8568091.1 enoyl-CoA hydratase/isomerase family protein [Alicyclobacillus tolerans]
MFDTIQYEVTKAGVAIITFLRPKVMNAINVQLGQELYAALKQVENDKTIRAVVITGSGRAFCSGQDLGERITMEEHFNLGDSVRQRYNPIVTKMHNLRIPTIAAVNGAAAGAGFGLALACDLRFAAKGAKFTMAFSKIGLVPDSGSSYFLTRLAGIGKALEWTWTADVLTAETLAEYGVVNRVFEPQELVEETLAFAERLASGPTLAYSLTKQAMYENFQSSLGEALEREARLQGIAGRSHDFREGVRAFIEKRPPKYLGM